jgi:hypothetical protein
MLPVRGTALGLRLRPERLGSLGWSGGTDGARVQ